MKSNNMEKVRENEYAAILALGIIELTKLVASFDILRHNESLFLNNATVELLERFKRTYRELGSK